MFPLARDYRAPGVRRGGGKVEGNPPSPIYQGNCMVYRYLPNGIIVAETANQDHKAYYKSLYLHICLRTVHFLLLVVLVGLTIVPFDSLLSTLVEGALTTVLLVLVEGAL